VKQDKLYPTENNYNFIMEKKDPIWIRILGFITIFLVAVLILIEILFGENGDHKTLHWLIYGSLSK
jgi:hypothetical protein